jgi:UDP-N-acetylmuramyl pentapeptide phosphotransferase/UDP-N-acetylglucosamine-1-phosphate transferase
MKIAGIILIIAGVLMLVFRNINFTTEKNVVDAGPIQIDKKEDHSIGWPVYVGGIVIIAGIAVLVAGSKKSG